MNLKSFEQKYPVFFHYILILGVAFIYYGMARLGLLIAIEKTNATPVWPPSGLAFATLLLLGDRAWIGIFLGAFMANVTSFVGQIDSTVTTILMGSAFISLGNTLEALTGTYLLRRLTQSRQPLDQVQNVFKFLFVALVMCLVSACIGPTSLYLLQIIKGDVYQTVWLTWWLGDVSGIIILSPLLLTCFRAPFQNWTKKLLFETILVLSLVFVLSQYLFGDWLFTRSFNSQAYLLIPLLLWCVFRLGEFVALIATVILTAVAILNTIHGVGPFVVGSINVSLISLQVFSCVVASTMMVLSATIKMQKKSDRELKLVNQSLEKMIEDRTSVLKQKTNDLEITNAELERFNRASVGREKRIIELKVKINELSQSLDKAPPYPLSFLNADRGESDA